MNISDEILKSIEIIVDKKLKGLRFDRTIDGKIIRKTNAGYLVGMEGTELNVTVNGTAEYEKNDSVKVVIPQNHINGAYIQGYPDNRLPYMECTGRIYSDSEQTIGVCNGKTLFQRVLQTGARSIPAASWGTLGYISPFLNIVNIYGTYESGTGFYALTTASYRPRYLSTTGAIDFYNASSDSVMSVSNFTVILEYTR